MGRFDLNLIERIVSTIHLDSRDIDDIVPYVSLPNSVKVYDVLCVGGDYDRRTIAMCCASTSIGIVYSVGLYSFVGKERLSRELIYKEESFNKDPNLIKVKELFEEWARPVLLCDEAMKRLQNN